MKFVTFKDDNLSPTPGVLTDDQMRIVSLGSAFPDMITLIEAGETGLATARRIQQQGAASLAYSADRLLAPVPRPPRMRDCSVFEEHIKGGAKFFEKIGRMDLAKIPEIWYQEPIYYKCNHLSVVGPETDIIWPSTGQRLDYELEIAAVIGKPGKDIPPEQALEHLFGFTIYNDLSMRDVAGELSGMLGPAKAKDFDGGNILGPWLVTKDEFPDFDMMDMRASLNGEVMGGGSSSGMYHKWDRIISYASKGETLYAGEVIGSGTVGGGTLIEKGRGLSDGDVIEFSVTGLGVLCNRVAKK